MLFVKLKSDNCLAVRHKLTQEEEEYFLADHPVKRKDRSIAYSDLLAAGFSLLTGDVAGFYELQELNDAYL